MEPNNNQNRNNNQGKTPNFMSMVILAMVTLFLISMISRVYNNGTSTELTYNEFMEMIQTQNIEKVEIDESYRKITVTVKPSDASSITEEYYTAIVGDQVEDVKAILTQRGISVKGTVIERTSWLTELLIYMFPVLLVWGIFMFAMRRGGGVGGGIMGIGKSNAKMYMQKETGVTFADVAGQDEAEESLVEIVDFLHNPQKYTEIGAKLPKGALLVGPPGTGKTLLAKAVAGEAHVPFFSLAGSDFVEMFVGVGASRVRDLFKQAQQNAPCIIFIDEIDAIGKSRDTRFGGNDEREQTLNQLLSEMDGFDSGKGVFILAATNRPEVLDPALLRPGRLDRRIIVDKPDLKGRIAVLKVHAKNVRMDDSVNLEEIALATAGAVGSDLANMINEAAILAVKNKRKYVNQADLFESVEVVIAGKEKKDRVMNEQERKMVSYHEVGHALAAALQKGTEPVQKITIVPRTMGSLGYVMQTPEEEKFLMTKAEMEAELVTLLAGRASEELFFDSISTGASNDIEKATRMARAMVTRYGMSEEFGLMGLETVEGQYLEGRTVMNCGDATAARIDGVVEEMLKKAYDKAKALLSENKDAMHRIADFLIKKETITGKEFMEILHQVQEERKHWERVAMEEKAKREAAERVIEIPPASEADIAPEEAVTAPKEAVTAPKEAVTAPEEAATAPEAAPVEQTGSDTDPGEQP